MLLKRLFVIVAIMLASSALNSVMCQTAGTISGRVSDAEKGDPLPGASVMLEGTSLGASTKLDGTFTILNVPPRSYRIRVSYIGYATRELTVQIGESSQVKEDLKLDPVGLKGKEVVVTAQAVGQNAAINQQLSSQNIVSVVSAARIQELPDANAAESVGRLPGVYLLRTGGEGYAVAIRGMEPTYNQVMIDGVQMPSIGPNDRHADMSMISSSMLSGIEIYKTVTPDMDAAVFGGVVNFQIQEAQRTTTGTPEINLSLQGGYDHVQNAYNDYKLLGSVGDRYLDDRFGVIAQGVIENVNLTSGQLNATYDLLTHKYEVSNPMELTGLTPTYSPSQRQRYDATLTLDYRLPKGKIELMNFFSRGDTKTETRGQTYLLGNNQITFNAGYSPNRLNVITNLLDFKQDILTFDVDMRFSHSYTENINTGSWSMNFLQSSAGLSSIPVGENPALIAQAAAAKVDVGDMLFNDLSTSNNFVKHRDIAGSLDIQRSFNFSDLVSATLKFGGQYKYASAFYDYNDGSGTLFAVTDQNARKAVLEVFPWLTQPPYNLSGPLQFPIAAFSDPSYTYGRFLSGAYTMGLPINLGFVSQVLQVVVDSTRGQPVAGGNTYPYAPDVYGSGASDYTGGEYQSAGYIMATINVGTQITIIPGVRYQGLKTSYNASWYFDAGAQNPYPYTLPHIDTTIDEYHGYWLPDVILRYKPLEWFDVRVAYTNTISYPEPTQITPVIDVNDNSHSVTWHNFALKPATSQNYDLALSFHNNSIGLFTAGGFIKQIDDMIFGTGTVFISDPSKYSGLPSRTKGYSLSTSINDPYRVNVLGTELEWQTHFWYLPWVLSGLVMDLNYTHIFSGAKYPYTITYPGVYPTYVPTHVDTFYTDRLIDQPKDIANLSVGYDYKGFSAVVSMIYQANVFNNTNFWPELRSDKAKYLRWDLVVKQGLPWSGLSAYFDINNINGATDTYVVEGSGFPTSAQDYGMTADIGLHWDLR